MSVECPVCKSANCSSVGEKEGCAIHRCTSCSTYFVSRYDRAKAEALYEGYHTTKTYVSKPKSKMRRSLRRVQRLKAQYGGKRFLDVGCNVGFTVEAARQVGYEANGSDIDPKAIEIARQMHPQCTFHSGGFEALKQAGLKFDVIYCAEVIEHTSDPISFARELAGLLTPGGILFLTTPDGGHMLRPRDFMQWNEVCPPQHLVWLNRGSLARVLKEAGFDTVRYRLNLKPGLRAFATKSAA